MQQKVDFFVSYAGPDRPWAEWIGARLQSQGYSVVLDVWDWQPGDNMISRTNDALMAADRVIALYSRKYFDRERFTARTMLAYNGGGADLIWYGAAGNRTKLAITGFGILDGYRGVLVRDDYGGYLSYDAGLAGVQQCLAHLYRYLATLQRHCRIRSYLTAARSHGRHPLAAIRDALTGNTWMPPHPA